MWVHDWSKRRSAIKTFAITIIISDLSEYKVIENMHKKKSFPIIVSGKYFRIVKMDSLLNILCGNLKIDPR